MSTFIGGAGEVFGGSMDSATDALGFTDHETESKTMDIAEEQSERSYELTKDQIEFQQEQYDDWKSIYGDLQEDIGTYYKNLTGDSISSQQLTAIQKESQAAQTQIDQSLAQRGLTGSGLQAEATTQNILGTAQQKANVRANADRVAEEQKMQFLGLGLGQGTEMLGTQAQVASSGASSLAGMANTALGSSVGLTQTGLQVTGSKSEEMGQSISGMFGSDIKLKDNIVKLGEIKGIEFFSWTWNELGNNLGYYGPSMGVIAQKIIDIIPNAVIEIDDHYEVDYKKVMNYIGAN